MVLPLTPYAMPIVGQRPPANLKRMMSESMGLTPSNTSSSVCRFCGLHSGSNAKAAWVRRYFSIRLNFRQRHFMKKYASKFVLGLQVATVSTSTIITSHSHSSALMLGGGLNRLAMRLANSTLEPASSRCLSVNRITGIEK
jgi:hypothetical protein